MFARARNFICTVLTTPTYQKTTFNPAQAITMESKRLSSNALDANASITVIHDPVGQEFHIEFPDSRAFLLYEMEGDIIKIMHTEVPEAAQGKGVAKFLAQAALRHIEEHKYRAEAHCDYFRHYVEKYDPKYLKYFEN